MPATNQRRRGASRRRTRPRGLRETFKRIVRIWVDLFQEHGLLTFAAAISFQALVALVALLLLGVAVVGELGRTDIWTTQIAPALEPKVLLPVFGGIDATIEKVFRTDSTGLIAFASALAVWEVSGMVRACMSALSRVYGKQDDRPWYVRFPLSIGIALVLTAAIVAAVLLVLAAKGSAHGVWHWPLFLGRWLGAVLLVALAFGVLVRWAPAESRSKRWASGGSALVTVAWLVQSLIFGWYLRSVANYKTAAGSLTAVYFLTTFLYVAAIILLVGIELDELIRKDIQNEADEPHVLTLVRRLF